MMTMIIMMMTSRTAYKKHNRNTRSTVTRGAASQTRHHPKQE